MTNNIRKLIDSEIRKFNSLVEHRTVEDIDKKCEDLILYASSVDSELIDIDGELLDAIVVSVATKNVDINIEKVNNVEYEKMHDESLVLVITDKVIWATYSGDAFFDISSDVLVSKKNCVYHKVRLEFLDNLQEYHFQ